MYPKLYPQTLKYPIFYFFHGFKQTKIKWNKNIVRKKVCNTNGSNRKQMLKA